MAQMPYPAQNRQPASCERRSWMARAGLWAWPTPLLLAWPARAAAYPITAAAMREAQAGEMGVYYRYTEFARKASQEDYRGIAYLFAAFAAAEFVHAANFGRIQTGLGVEVSPIAKAAFNVGSTRDNLMAAADGEIRSVDEYYPRLLERIRPEGHADAMAAVGYAWETEKRHRDKIRQVQRWSPSFFEQVAKVIDQKTGQYHVCQLCGCTLNQVPTGICPVCKNLPRHYRLIEPPA
jgi:rubrerythrin